MPSPEKPIDLRRYTRHYALAEIGEKGQAVLAHSSVAVIGCGALGSFEAEFLARAGVGRVLVVDRDQVELHNLPRQTLYTEQDVHDRSKKAEAAAKHLRLINSQVITASVVADVQASNVEKLIEPFDVVVDGTDNFETRFLLNDACVKARKPYVYGGVLRTTGTVMAVRPGLGPCLRCVFPTPPEGKGLPNCQTHGVINTIVATTAGMVATQAFKILLGEGPEPKPLWTFDIWKGAFHSVAVKRREDCPCCVLGKYDFLDFTRG